MLGMKKEFQKYTLKEKLSIAESISTVLMFLMAVWGSIVAYEVGFWHKVMHIVNHYHSEIGRLENNDKNIENIEEKGFSEMRKEKK